VRNTIGFHCHVVEALACIKINTRILCWL